MTQKLSQINVGAIAIMLIITHIIAQNRRPKFINQPETIEPKIRPIIPALDM